MGAERPRAVIVVGTRAADLRQAYALPEDQAEPQLDNEPIGKIDVLPEFVAARDPASEVQERCSAGCGGAAESMESHPSRAAISLSRCVRTWRSVCGRLAWLAHGWRAPCRSAQPGSEDHISPHPEMGSARRLRAFENAATAIRATLIRKDWCTKERRLTYEKAYGRFPQSDGIVTSTATLR